MNKPHYRLHTDGSISLVSCSPFHAHAHGPWNLLRSNATERGREACFLLARVINIANARTRRKQRAA